MICVIQRVSQASATVDGQIVGQIGQGMLVLAAVQAADLAEDVAWTARKLASLRIFAGGERNFDRDVKEIGGSILLISNFTLAADARKGRRPSLAGAADQAAGREKFDQLVAAVRALGVNAEIGRFGADMQIALVNDGPVTFILNSREK
ncbi:MAG: D-aminoacyl-tRNA deacylase [Tepidisphaeraceae bacterium]